MAKKEPYKSSPEDIRPAGSSVVSRSISTEMRESYLDYAMTVITARALPDVRDGLKPVHRRILYTMQQMGLQPNRATRKCEFAGRHSLHKFDDGLEFVPERGFSIGPLIAIFWTRQTDGFLLY